MFAFAVIMGVVGEVFEDLLSDEWAAAWKERPMGNVQALMDAATSAWLTSDVLFSDVWGNEDRGDRQERQDLDDQAAIELGIEAGHVELTW